MGAPGLLGYSRERAGSWYQVRPGCKRGRSPGKVTGWALDT